MTDAQARAAGLTEDQIAALKLSSGGHADPELGHCLLEVVSMFAGETFGDHPACVDPVLGAFGRAWNDGMRCDAEREQLKRYIPLLPGTAQGDALSQVRGFMAIDWVIRVHTPAWLDLSPKLAEHAAALRALAPITGEQQLAAAQPTLDQAQRAAAAARDAAWDAAWDAARAAAWAAARAAAWDAARAAARDAARAAARAAAWDAARAAARDAARAAARAAAWDAARAAAWAAAWDAARAAAWDAARAAAWDAAWAAAWAAARAAAWDAARAAAPGAERAAADAALEPTTLKLQASAHDLYLDMINAEIQALAAPALLPDEA